MSTREQARRRRPSRTTTSARRAAVVSRVAQVAHAKSCLGGVEPRERRRDRAADRATAQVELTRTGARARDGSAKRSELNFHANQTRKISFQHSITARCVSVTDAPARGCRERRAARSAARRRARACAAVLGTTRSRARPCRSAAFGSPRGRAGARPARGACGRRCAARRRPARAHARFGLLSGGADVLVVTKRVCVCVSDVVILARFGLLTRACSRARARRAVRPAGSTRRRRR